MSQPTEASIWVVCSMRDFISIKKKNVREIKYDTQNQHLASTFSNSNMDAYVPICTHSDEQTCTYTTITQVFTCAHIHDKMIPAYKWR